MYKHMYMYMYVYIYIYIYIYTCQIMRTIRTSVQCSSINLHGFDYRFTNYSFNNKNMISKNAIQCHPFGNILFKRNQGSFLKLWL